MGTSQPLVRPNSHPPDLTTKICLSYQEQKESPQSAGYFEVASWGVLAAGAAYLESVL
jgi:hypothetical protein